MFACVLSQKKIIENIFLFTKSPARTDSYGNDHHTTWLTHIIIRYPRDIVYDLKMLKIILNTTQIVIYSEPPFACAKRSRRQIVNVSVRSTGLYWILDYKRIIIIILSTTYIVIYIVNQSCILLSTKKQIYANSWYESVLRILACYIHHCAYSTI